MQLNAKWGLAERAVLLLTYEEGADSAENLSQPLMLDTRPKGAQSICSNT